MEDVSYDELLMGLSSEALRAQRSMIVTCLVNKIAEDATNACISDADAESLFSGLISAAHSAKDSEGSVRHGCLIALSNLTVTEQACTKAFTQIKASSALHQKFHACISAFLASSPQLESGDSSDSSGAQTAAIVSANTGNIGAAKTEITEDPEDPWQYMSAVLCNLAQVEDGRKLILNQSTGYTPKLLEQLGSRNVQRRRGSIGCLRSCLFDQDAHWWLVHEVKVLNYLLTPLIVGTPFSDKEKEGMDPRLWIQALNSAKRPESDWEVAQMLLESIVLLCQRRGIREKLRRSKVYPIIRNYYYSVTNTDTDTSPNPSSEDPTFGATSNTTLNTTLINSSNTTLTATSIPTGTSSSVLKEEGIVTGNPAVGTSLNRGDDNTNSGSGSGTNADKGVVEQQYGPGKGVGKDRGGGGGGMMIVAKTAEDEAAEAAAIAKMSPKEREEMEKLDKLGDLVQTIVDFMLREEGGEQLGEAGSVGNSTTTDTQQGARDS